MSDIAIDELFERARVREDGVDVQADAVLSGIVVMGLHSTAADAFEELIEDNLGGGILGVLLYIPTPANKCL